MKRKKNQKRKERKKELIKRERDFLRFIFILTLLPLSFPLFLSVFLPCMIWPLPNPPLIPRSMNNLSEM